MKIVQVDPTRPLDQFLRAQTNAIVDRAATENAMRNSWAKQGLLLNEVAAKLDRLLETEELMNVMSLDMQEELMDLLYRVRKA